MISVVLPECLTYIGRFSFYNCASLTTINFPENITEIGDNAFSATSITGDINLPNLEALGTGVFRDTKISSVTSLGKITILKSSSTNFSVFSGCTNLSLVNLPETLVEIGTAVFNNCTSLEKIEIPENVTTIKDSVFSGCTNLKMAIVNPTTPPTAGGNMFYNTHADLKIYVPNDSVEAYKEATNWSNYADKIHPMSEYAE